MAKGRSTMEVTMTTEAMSAVPCARPPASNTRDHCVESHSMPPPSVSASSAAAPTSMSTMPTRDFATV